MRRRPDDGFTLIEVLLATLILGIIFGAITEAMVMGLRTSDSTDRRLRESIDAQVLSTVFGRDVQSAASVSVTDTTCGAGTPVVSLGWTDPADPSPSSATRRASYVVAADPGGDRNSTNEIRTLTRSYCEGGTLLSQRRVASYLASGATAATAQCDGGSCPGASPRRITLTINEVNGFTYAVEAVRRTA